MPYRDKSLSPLERAKALLPLMTVTEKTHQLVGTMPQPILSRNGLDEDLMQKVIGNGIGHISGVGIAGGAPEGLAKLNNGIQRYLRDSTRLGIPAIVHNEALNGLLADKFTSFPTAIALAATWNTDAVKEMTQIIRRQALAVGVRQALSPMLDVSRDARFGRIHESYGEEVLLVSAMAVAYVSGIQGEDLSQGVIATAKHFLGYAWTEAGLNLSSTQIGPRELYDVYATPFEAAIKLANLQSVMNSYSEIDGSAVTGSPAILTDLLRGKLGFDGTVAADYRSVQYLADRQRVAKDAEEAGILALTAGLDVELPSAWAYGHTLASAVEHGKVSEDLVDRAVIRVLTQKFALGLFENPFVDEDPIQLAAIASEGVELASSLSQQSITLLKNEGTVLPFSQDVKRIAVIGPHANSVLVNFANYTYPSTMEMIKGMMAGKSRLVGMEGAHQDMSDEAKKDAAARIKAMMDLDLEKVIREKYQTVSLTEAIAQLLPNAEVTFVEGCGIFDTDENDIESAVEAAQNADIVILAIGGKSGAFAGKATEGEGTDTADIDLPSKQVELVNAIAAVGKPTAAVLYMGRAYGLGGIDDVVPAILTGYFSGQEGSPALARALFGLDSPSGKLPISIPRYSGQVPIYQAQRRGSGYRREPIDMAKAYADMPSTPLYHFGHGLSYSQFEYSDFAISNTEIDTDGYVQVSITIQNVGDYDAAEVVQLYFGLFATVIARPAQQLVGFSRVQLDKGAKARVHFKVQATQLGFTGLDGRFIVEPGLVEVILGSSSEDIRARGEFMIVGDIVDVSATRSYLPEVSVTKLA